MHTEISFPNLGITLPHVGQSITVFGVSIAYYGIIIGCGILLGILLAAWNAKRSGQDPDTYLDIALYGVIFGVIGARIYYVIFSFDDYKDNLLQIFNLRGGGLAIYGGVIAAVAVVWVYAKRKKLSFLILCDTAMPSLILGQILGRWGNFFNREAFGEYTNSLFAMRLPVDAVYTSNITEKMWAHAKIIDGVSWIQVHPTFLYESVWNLIVLLCMLYVFGRKKFDGQVMLIYLGAYGFGRFWIEGLRTDQLLIPGTHLAASQILAAVLFVGSVVLYGVLRKRGKKEENPLPNPDKKSE